MQQFHFFLSCVAMCWFDMGGGNSGSSGCLFQNGEMEVGGRGGEKAIHLYLMRRRLVAAV